MFEIRVILAVFWGVLALLSFALSLVSGFLFLDHGIATRKTIIIRFILLGGFILSSFFALQIINPGNTFGALVLIVLAAIALLVEFFTSNMYIKLLRRSRKYKKSHQNSKDKFN